MLYKMVLSFESVDEILKCDHSNESYQAVLSCGAVYYAVQDGSVITFTGESVDHLNETSFVWCRLYLVNLQKIIVILGTLRLKKVIAYNNTA